MSAVQTDPGRDPVPGLAVDLAVGLAVLLVGAYELGSRWDLAQQRGLSLPGMVAVTVAVAVAAGLARRRPVPALLLAGLVGLGQLWAGTVPVLGAELLGGVVVAAALAGLAGLAARRIGSAGREGTR